MKVVDPANLEAALPSLIEKLRTLKEGLSADEQVLFDEIIQSAAAQTEMCQADDELDHDSRRYGKPVSVHATTSIKREFLSLPDKFGLVK